MLGWSGIVIDYRTDCLQQFSMMATWPVAGAMLMCTRGGTSSPIASVRCQVLSATLSHGTATREQQRMHPVYGSWTEFNLALSVIHS